MTRPLTTLIDAFAAGFFAVSLLVATLGAAGHGRLASVADPLAGEVQGFSTSPYDWALLDRLPTLSGLVGRPDNPVSEALILTVALAALVHLALGLRRRGPLLSARMNAGLILAAVWPWLRADGLPAALTAAAAAALMITALPTRPEGAAEPPRPEPDRAARPVIWPAAFIAGWTLILACTLAAAVTRRAVGLSDDRAILLALLLAALIGTRAQLYLGNTVSFSLALIWAMIGIAAVTVGSSITLATACVLGISALAVVLVRVTT